MNLTTLAEQATRRARLIEALLLDGIASRAIEERKRADPKGEPQVAVCWQRDGNATINGRVVQGRAGELQLVVGGVAQVLVDSGAAVIREPLTLPPWQRLDVAGELWEVAAELQAAALALAPQPAEPPTPAEREGV
jgi:hypothetical protein